MKKAFRSLFTVTAIQHSKMANRSGKIKELWPKLIQREISNSPENMEIGSSISHHHCTKNAIHKYLKMQFEYNA